MLQDTLQVNVLALRTTRLTYLPSLISSLPQAALSGQPMWPCFFFLAISRTAFAPPSQSFDKIITLSGRLPCLVSRRWQRLAPKAVGPLSFMVKALPITNVRSRHLFQHPGSATWQYVPRGCRTPPGQFSSARCFREYGPRRRVCRDANGGQAVDRPL